MTKENPPSYAGFDHHRLHLVPVPSQSPIQYVRPKFEKGRDLLLAHTNAFDTDKIDESEWDGECNVSEMK